MAGNARLLLGSHCQQNSQLFYCPERLYVSVVRCWRYLLEIKDMIIGLGSDLCDIRRIEEVLARHGERFTHRIFTEGERAKSERRAARAPSYARRFAAKEACSKALGTGLSQGVFWRDMEVINLPGGRPTLKLTGAAAARLKAMTPEGHEALIHITLTDDPPMALAFVVIEALPVV